VYAVWINADIGKSILLRRVQLDILAALTAYEECPILCGVGKLSFAYIRARS